MEPNALYLMMSSNALYLMINAGSSNALYSPGGELWTDPNGLLQPGKYVFKVSTFYPEKIGKYSNSVTFL